MFDRCRQLPTASGLHHDHWREKLFRAGSEGAVSARDDTPSGLILKIAGALSAWADRAHHAPAITCRTKIHNRIDRQSSGRIERLCSSSMGWASESAARRVQDRMTRNLLDRR
jgi:hypothetical protein